MGKSHKRHLKFSSRVQLLLLQLTFTSKHQSHPSHFSKPTNCAVHMMVSPPTGFH